MKLIFDNDGTALDFNKFISDDAVPYFEKKYGMSVVYPKKLEVEDQMDMKKFFEQNSTSKEEAQDKYKKALDGFWVGPEFIKYSLLNNFRPGFKKYINKCVKDGMEIEIHTSRSKTCKKNLIGAIARGCTVLQYKLRGVKVSSNDFHFYENDEEKIKGIIAAKPDMAFDDKPSIVSALSESGIKTVCVKGTHNDEVTNSKNVYVLNGFEAKEVETAMQKLIGKEKLELQREIAKSDKFFEKLIVFRPTLMNYFKPIILHRENIAVDKSEPAIYAPNHRKTLDPVVITGVLFKNIHWAALKRFFDAKDSVFSNSKNPILCKITSKFFKEAMYFPIERQCDNPNANNIDSVKKMYSTLKLGQSIGIFAEGTTRRPAGAEFGTFDDSFISLAKSTGCIVRPVTTFWSDNKKAKNRLVINFGTPFYVSKKASTEEIMEMFLKIQRDSLEENKKCLEETIEQNKVKKLKKI